MPSFPIWAAIRTVKSKVGTWVGYEKYREADPSMTREDWARAIGEARAAIAHGIAETSRPLGRRPTGDEIQPITRKTGTGYWQQVEIYVRDRDTGIVGTRHYTIRGDSVRSRISVVNEAMDRYQSAIDTNPDDYPEDIAGAAYVGTYQIMRR